MANPVEIYADTLGPEDRKVLAGSLLFALKVVAHADSDTDSKEQQRIEATLALAPERLGAAFGGSDFPDALRAASELEWLQTPYLKALAQVVRKMPNEARVVYDRALVELAIGVAAASGGFFGLGSKLSDHEKYALKRLVGALGLEVDPEHRKVMGA